MFENKTFGLPCPKCGHKTKKTLAWIKANDEFTCDGCGGVVRTDKEKLLAGIDELESGISKARKGLARFGKLR
jgi:transcription elongation factor Elf1